MYIHYQLLITASHCICLSLISVFSFFNFVSKNEGGLDVYLHKSIVSKMITLFLLKHLENNL